MSTEAWDEVSSWFIVIESPVASTTVDIALPPDIVNVSVELSATASVPVSAVTVLNAFNTTVPDSSGKVIVLSAVGSTTVRSVSKSLAVVPSNLIILSSTICIVSFDIVWSPWTVKF